MVMQSNWLTAVDRYLNQLEESLDQIDHCGMLFLEHTSQGNFGRIEEASNLLLAATQVLEKLLDARGEILQAATTPGEPRPRSLRSALQQAGETQRLELAEAIVSRVEAARQQSITLFVTQYQLFETSEMVLRKLLNQAPDPGTYGTPVKRQGGGLLDDAA
jgi:hypothetical protein